jgi:DNA-directed RNA polymerase subunit RPC12/RpoP
MIRFTCSRCDKGLRADESKAGSIAKCPSCGHKVSIPAPHPEPTSPEDAEPGGAERASRQGEESANGPVAEPRKRIAAGGLSSSLFAWCWGCTFSDSSIT